MKYLIFTISVLFIAYILNNEKQHKLEVEFMSKDHTSMIKGIAILMVILNHMGGKFGIRYLTPLGGIGVAMFLICSGYGLVISYKKNGIKNYWSKKIIGVLIPYIIIEILIAFFRQNNTIINIIGDLLIIGSKHPYGWYLKYLLFLYVVFYALAKLDLLSKSKLGLFYILSILIVMSRNQLWAEQALSFTLGVTIAYYKDNIICIIRNNKFIPFILLSIGILFLGIKQINIFRESPYIIFNVIQLIMKLSIACSIMIYIYKYIIFIKCNIFIKLGNLSYILYLVHAYTIKILLNLNYINILIFLIGTIVLAKILKIYVLEFINKIINKKFYVKRDSSS